MFVCFFIKLPELRKCIVELNWDAGEIEQIYNRTQSSERQYYQNKWYIYKKRAGDNFGKFIY